MSKAFVGAEGKQIEQMWCWGMPYCIVRDFVETEIITFEEYGLLTKIYLMGNRGGPSWATNETLAEWWNKSKGHVSRSINKFIQLGLLRVQYIRKDTQVVRRYLWVIIQSPPNDDMMRNTASTPTHKQHQPLRTYAQENTINKNTINLPMPVPGPVGPSQAEELISKFSKNIFKFLNTTGTISKSDTPRRYRRAVEQILRYKLAGDVTRLRRTLQFYAQKPHTKYTPTVHSASDLRIKFLKIEAWVNKHWPPESEPTIEFEITSRRVIKE